MRYLSLCTAVAMVVVTGSSGAQRGGQRGGAPAGGAQGAGGAALTEPNPQPYATVVTSDARTRAGMFTVHNVGNRMLFEIPRRELNKDQLLVMAIPRTVLGTGYGAQAAGNRVVRWERMDNRVYLRGVSYATIADSTRPEYRAMSDANTPPIIAAFNVEAYGADSSAVIDVSRTFLLPPAELSPGGRIPGTIDLARSWVERATPFPDNLNVYSTFTFAQTVAAAGGRGGAAPAPAGGGRAATPNTNPSNTIEFSWSFHHLPDTPMMGRLCDSRVGYASVTMTDYTDRGDYVHTRCYIARYRLEKKDPAAAVSDPVKPIVYYVDPATPAKWVPYVKRGIEEWQAAFREAGFSNAIVAREAPNDPDWSSEDARHSVVHWLPSLSENASGGHVSDPRSGEIIHGDVQYYQNIERLQLGWYFTQASAVDPRARRFPYPDSLMGRLLQQAVAHEVGHTLGFPHNMKASSQYPTDSLRSESFLRVYGFSPSIMDYARYNYLVQPEDKVALEWLLPRVGPYDRFAVMWGVKPIPNARTPEEERPTLDQWAREQDTKPWLRFSTAGAAGSDPGDETEAVGDMDAVKATGWGLRNIKREMAYLMPATVKPDENYDDLADLYRRLIGQWRTELGHVVNVVGGYDSQERYGSQPGPRFWPVSRQRQQDAVRFLNENAFRTPTFLLDDNITQRLAPGGDVARIDAAQSQLLAAALQDARLLRLSDQESAAKSSGSAYTMQQLLADLRHGIFSELARGERIDPYRRTLQRVYIENLNLKLNPAAAGAVAAGRGGGGGGGGRGAATGLDPKLSDIRAVVHVELTELDAELRAAIPRTSDRLSKAHLDDLRRRIADALKGRAANADAVEEGPG
jgi:hypothetical protein